MNIVKLQNDLKDLSDRQLMDTMQAGSAPQYLVLSEMQRRKKMRAEVASKPQPPTSVAEETMQGLATMPQVPRVQMADGGIVAFAKGGYAKGEAEACWTDPNTGKSMCPPEQAKMVGKKFAGGKSVASDEAKYLMQLLQQERGGLPFSPEEISRLVELSNQQSVDMGTAVYQDKTIAKDPEAKAKALKGEGGFSYDPKTKKYYGTQENRLLTQNLPAITGEVGSEEYLNSIRTKYSPLFRDTAETDTSRNGHSGKMEDFTSPAYPIRQQMPTTPQAEDKPAYDASMPTDGIPLAAGLFGPTPRGPERRNPQDQNLPFGSGGQMMSSGLENLIRAITGPDEEDFYLPQQPIIRDIRGDTKTPELTAQQEAMMNNPAMAAGAARDSELLYNDPTMAPKTGVEALLEGTAGVKPMPQGTAGQQGSMQGVANTIAAVNAAGKNPVVQQNIIDEYQRAGRSMAEAEAQARPSVADRVREPSDEENALMGTIGGQAGFARSSELPYIVDLEESPEAVASTTEPTAKADPKAEAAAAEEKINQFLADRESTAEAKSTDPLSELYDEIKAQRDKKYEPNINEFLMRAGLSAAVAGGKSGDFIGNLAQGGLEGLKYLSDEKAAKRREDQEALSDMVKLIGSRELSAAKAVSSQQAQAKSYLDAAKALTDQLESGTVFTTEADINAAKKRIQELYRAYNTTMGLPVAATGTDPSAFKIVQ